MMREFLAFIFIVCSFSTYGQTLEDKHHRVLILLDASLSMNEPVDGYATKYAAASDIIIRLMDSIYHRNDEVEFGLRVYGHQYPASARQCFDTKLEVQFSRDNIEQMKMRLANVKPRGISNTYTALKEALEYDISSTNNYVYHILIITDGGEACNDKDICSLSDLLKYKQVASPCIVSTSNTLKYPCFTTGAIQMVKSNTDFTVNYYVKQCLLIPEKAKVRMIDYEQLSHPIISDPTVNNTNESNKNTDSDQAIKIVRKQTTSTNKTLKYTAEYIPIIRNNNKHLLPQNTQRIKLTQKQVPEFSIPTDSGYLKISEVPINSKIEVYKVYAQSNQFNKTLVVSDKMLNQRITLAIGKYKLILITENERLSLVISILPRMIREVQTNNFK